MFKNAKRRSYYPRGDFMNAFIDQDGCIACGQCYSICPEVFGAGENGIAFVSRKQVPKAQEEDALNAEQGCPTSVISLSDTE